MSAREYIDISPTGRGRGVRRRRGAGTGRGRGRGRGRAVGRGRGRDRARTAASALIIREREREDSLTPPLPDATEYATPPIVAEPETSSEDTTSAYRDRSETPPMYRPTRPLATSRRPLKRPRGRLARGFQTPSVLPVETETSLSSSVERSQQASSSLPSEERSSSFKKSTSKRAKRTIYPIFAECMECTDDPEWKDYLSDAAAGKLNNATFAHNRLKSRGSISEKLTVENLGSLQNVFLEIMNFFQQKMQICFTDMDKRKAESMETPIYDPKSLNAVSVKQTSHLLWSYAETMGDINDMTPSEVSALYQDINFNVIMKTLPKTDIIMENKKVTNIKWAKIVDNRLTLSEGRTTEKGARRTVAASDSVTASRSSTTEDLDHLLESGKVLPIDSDFRLDYGKNKMATRWKRLVKSIG